MLHMLTPVNGTNDEFAATQENGPVLGVRLTWCRYWRSAKANKPNSRCVSVCVLCVQIRVHAEADLRRWVRRGAFRCGWCLHPPPGLLGNSSPANSLICFSSSVMITAFKARRAPVAKKEQKEAPPPAPARYEKTASVAAATCERNLSCRDVEGFAPGSEPFLALAFEATAGCWTGGCSVGEVLPTLRSMALACATTSFAPTGLPFLRAASSARRRSFSFFSRSHSAF